MGLLNSSQDFFDNITDAEGKISQDLKLEVDNCGDPYCRVRRGRPTCSNTYFEDLPAGYKVEGFLDTTGAMNDQETLFLPPRC